MARIRVLVVDDAVVMRKMITETLRQDPELEVVGAAAHGKIALQKIPQVNPDVLTLDLEMPEMDGLTTLREVRKLYPTLPIILFSTLSQRGASATLEALAAGANDYVTKPANIGSVTEGMQRLEAELIPKIKLHCRRLLHPELPLAGSQRSGSEPVAFPGRLSVRKSPIEVVCIASSTGGPNALAAVFELLPGDFPVPIVIVQHMPPMFTTMLAERLSAHSELPCHEGAAGQKVEAGHAYVAPGGRHMVVQRSGCGRHLWLHEEPPENSCRPSADVLFRSVALAYEGAALGVVLTGMGQDGLRGCRNLIEKGGRVIAQDEATSVVWGMPGSVAQAGLAEKIVPLPQVASEVIARVREGRGRPDGPAVERSAAMRE